MVRASKLALRLLLARGLLVRERDRRLVRDADARRHQRPRHARGGARGAARHVASEQGIRQLGAIRSRYGLRCREEVAPRLAAGVGDVVRRVAAL